MERSGNDDEPERDAKEEGLNRRAKKGGKDEEREKSCYLSHRW